MKDINYWGKQFITEVDAKCSVCAESIPNRVQIRGNIVCLDCKKKKQQEYYKKNKAHILELKAVNSEKRNLKS